MLPVEPCCYAETQGLIVTPLHCIVRGMNVQAATAQLASAKSISQLRDVARSFGIPLPGSGKVPEDLKQFWNVFHQRARTLPESVAASEGTRRGLTGEVQHGKLGGR